MAPSGSCVLYNRHDRRRGYARVASLAIMSSTTAPIVATIIAETIPLAI